MGIGDRRRRRGDQPCRRQHRRAPWTPQRKALLHDSRILPTRSLAAAIAAAAVRPPVFVSASGVGYYGRGRRTKTESSPAGDDFLARLCEEWEAEASRARAPPLASCTIRSGVVLERSGGALVQDDDAVPFLRRRPDGIGPPIHVLDSSHRLDRNGPLDRRHARDRRRRSTSPPRCRSRIASSRARWAGAMRRPALVPTPSFALKLMLGEMAGRRSCSPASARSRSARFARVSFPLPGNRSRVPGDLRRVSAKRTRARSRANERTSEPCERPAFARRLRASAVALAEVGSGAWGAPRASVSGSPRGKASRYRIAGAPVLKFPPRTAPNRRRATNR